VSIPIIGIAAATGIVTSLIALVSFFWGAFVFQEPLVNLYLALLSVLGLMLGIVLMTYFAKPSTNIRLLQESAGRINGGGKLPEKTGEAPQPDYVYIDSPLLKKDKENSNGSYVPSDASIDSPVKISDSSSTFSSSEPDKLTPWYRQRWFGYFAATFNGLYGGSIVAPLSFAKKYDDHLSGLDYVFSFGVGSFLVNLIILFIYWSIQNYYFRNVVITWKDLKIITIPALTAGMLWSGGNICSIFAVLNLGQAVGYSSCQANVLVGGLWGIFYFHEVHGVNILFWFMSASLAIGSLFSLSFLRG